jgi:Putative zinc-finger
VEPVSGCEQWHGAIAVDALGALAPEERAGLLAHLDGCADCRAVARELGQTASVLALVDDDDVSAMSTVPPDLTERVLGSLHDDALLARRRRRVRTGGVVVAIGAIAASLVLVLALGSPAAAPSHTEVLSGPSTASATATLTATSWGTAGTLHEHGLPPHGIYQVAMRTATGAWWTVASYRGVRGGAVDVPMSCFVPLAQITAIRVTDATGATVLTTSW